jgi:signal transduction histidine kinase
MTESALDSAVSTQTAARPRRRLGLSGKLLILTALFIMLAEVLIYVPSVANFHRSLLADRLAAAQVAVLVLDAAPDGAAPRDLELKLLDQIGAAAVAVKTGERRRLMAATDMPPMPAREVDLRSPPMWESVHDAFRTLVGGASGTIRAVGAGMDKMDFVEIILPEKPIRDAVRAYSINILLLSLFISALTALLVYLSLHLLIVRPIRRLSTEVTAFAADPEDVRRIVSPSGRGDEIGSVETALAHMERSLARELREKKHLAALGLAVSKINHDLRNMLASAQLFSDRLSQAADPVTQRFAPKLVSALDRAIAFCQSTLAYGRISEHEPARAPVGFADLVRDVTEALGIEADHPVRIAHDAPPDFTLSVDREQLYRILHNLMRNAVQALAASPAGGGQITLTALRAGGVVTIDIADDGPGIDPRLRARLFEAFNATARPGSTGLGLAIAAELVRLHGGSIMLREAPRGATFRIELPGA